jgi:ATP-independent RNA helicase DbpA
LTENQSKTDKDFSSLNLKPDLLHNLESLDYLQMTQIQAQCLPDILLGKDVISQGKTGSGKTAAFGLGILQKFDVKLFRIQALALCPTRELADQVANEIRRLARTIHNTKVLTLCGGTPFGPQIGSLEHGAHIIVGTPGRIEEHVRKGTIQLDNITTLVLDEADRMLEMGFQEELDKIIDKLPRHRQTLLFSATYPDQIKSIAKRIMRTPKMVQTRSTHDDSVIEQIFYKVGTIESRMEALRLVLQEQQPESTVVFCNTKVDVQAVTRELQKFKFNAQALQGDMDQGERTRTLNCFSNKSISILVATDVAARGLDIETLDLVINFHIARDSQVHVHRIGRTGRAGNKGLACSFFNDKEKHKIMLLEEYLERKISSSDLPKSNLLERPINPPPMTTLQISGGKKQKVRPGDILGALTGNKGIAGTDVGKIHISDNSAYVAIKTQVAKQAFKKLTEGKLKGRSFQVRFVEQESLNIN